MAAPLKWRREEEEEAAEMLSALKRKKTFKHLGKRRSDKSFLRKTLSAIWEEGGRRWTVDSKVLDSFGPKHLKKKKKKPKTTLK